MLALLVAATIGQCGTQSYGYGVRYAQPTYAVQAYAAPTYVKTVYTAVQSYAPVQQAYAPAYSLVGDLARQDAAYKAQVEQAAQIKYLTTLLERQVTVQQPSPQPQQYQIPYQQTYGSPQAPSKTIPSPPVPSPQYPPAAEFAPPPPLAPAKQQPASFGAGAAGTSWQSPQAGGALLAILGSRCAECHSGDSTRGLGVQLLTADGQLSPDIQRYKDDIARDLITDRMPRDRPKLGDAEKMAVIRELAGAAAPAGAPIARANPSFGY